MIIKIFALLIGLMLAGAGIYYLNRSKNDAEGRKIYQIVTIIGAVMAVGGVSALLLG